jgi:hypothetical protein
MNKVSWRRCGIVAATGACQRSLGGERRSIPWPLKYRTNALQCEELRVGAGGKRLYPKRVRARDVCGTWQSASVFSGRDRQSLLPGRLATVGLFVIFVLDRAGIEGLYKRRSLCPDRRRGTAMSAKWRAIKCVERSSRGARKTPQRISLRGKIVGPKFPLL